VRLADIARATRGAPRSANFYSPPLSSQSPDLKADVQRIAEMQREELTRIQQWNVAGARRSHTAVDRILRSAARRWPHDSVILNLCGYHRKNAYTLKHWGAIQGGRPPKDPLLRLAERWFFKTLFVNPNDYSGLDGLSSVLIYEKDYDAAEFFSMRAIALAAEAGIDYLEAKQNLAMIRSRKPGGAPSAPPLKAGAPQESLTTSAPFPRHELEKALAEYNRAIALRPKNADLRLGRAATLVYLDRAGEAVKELSRAIKLRPGFIEAYSSLGAVLVGMGRYEEGIAQIEKTLKLRPDYPEALYNGACAWALTGYPERAIEWLERAIRYEPNYRETARHDPHLAGLREQARFRALAAAGSR
jgi:tetratricopeptide (TPR) repeat protein